jgi:hypothetical protein
LIRKRRDRERKGSNVQKHDLLSVGGHSEITLPRS